MKPWRGTMALPLPLLVWFFALCAAFTGWGCIALAQSKDAEPSTRQFNAAVLDSLPFSDRQDFDDARRGFVAALPDALIAGGGPRPVWSMKPYEFLVRDEAPATGNPRLSRHAPLDARHGPFKRPE